MTQDLTLHRLEMLRRGLIGIYGCVLTLMLVVIMGDLSNLSDQAPVGWLFVWGVTTLASVPVGILLLLQRPWGTVPLKARRGTAMGYLLVGFFNLFSLGLLTMIGSGWPFFFLMPIPYAAIIFVVYLRVFWLEDRDSGEIFP